MYSVEADKSKRLVVLSAAGRVTKEEAKQAAQRMRDSRVSDTGEHETRGRTYRHGGSGNCLKRRGLSDQLDG